MNFFLLNCKFPRRARTYIFDNLLTTLVDVALTNCAALKFLVTAQHCLLTQLRRNSGELSLIRLLRLRIVVNCLLSGLYGYLLSGLYGCESNVIAFYGPSQHHENLKVPSALQVQRHSKFMTDD